MLTGYEQKIKEVVRKLRYRIITLCKAERLAVQATTGIENGEHIFNQMLSTLRVWTPQKLLR